MNLLTYDKILYPEDIRNWLKEKMPESTLLGNIPLKDLARYQEHFNSRVDIIHGLGNMTLSEFWLVQKRKEKVSSLTGQFRVSNDGWMQLYELQKFITLWESKMNDQAPRLGDPAWKRLETKWRMLVINDDWHAYEQFLDKQKWAIKKAKEKKKQQKIVEKTRAKLLDSAPLFYDQLIDKEISKSLKK